MNTDVFKDKLSRLVALERNYLDHNETVQKIDKRIWGVMARFVTPNDDGTLKKKEVGDLQKAAKRGKLDNPILAADVISLVQSRDLLEARQDEIAEQMVNLVQDFPTRDWFVAHRGLKDFMFARLMANCGAPMSSFPTPAHLWSRFGLSVVDGKALKRQSGKKLEYSPKRRAFIIGVVGTNLMMQNPDWKKVYDWRKAYERDRAMAEGKIIKAASAITAKQAATGNYMSDGHIHARARRYMVKQFLKAFWEESTGESKPEELPGFVRAVRSEKKESVAA